jgi:diphthamide synthase (EF-2-diphthine--ammonia ligase)
MHAAKKAALLWSGGKDSALALFHARKNHPGIQINQARNLRRPGLRLRFHARRPAEAH